MTTNRFNRTYYRGYRLTLTSEGGTNVWCGEDLVATYDTMAQAQAAIDSWHEAA